MVENSRLGTSLCFFVIVAVGQGFVVPAPGGNSGEQIRNPGRNGSSAPRKNPPRSGYEPSCQSEIYCHGNLLHTVQMARLDHDSKTFVDQKMLRSPKEVKKNFDVIYEATEGHPSRDQVKQFVTENFGPSGGELQRWAPSDWTESPAFIKGIKDPDLRQYGSDLNDIWKILGRKVVADVGEHQDRYSLMYVPNPVIVPGGRFKEFYYWDQYWILKGLLHCEMYESVRGMIENFFHMVERIGYVPNGGRIYYTRSQPPMLASMVKDYVEATGNWTFVEQHLDILDKEFQFWMDNRTVELTGANGKKYRFVRYNSVSSGPRPESYREDYELARELKTKAEQDDLYINLKSGAESGWDFSSRWFLTPDPTKSGNLKNIKTREIIPVDLNAFICRNAKIMATFHRQINSFEEAVKYDLIAAEWSNNINDILWNSTLGCWFDYDIQHNRQRTDFYPSNIFPLWANVSVANNRFSTASRVLNYLRNSGALGFPGGVPTSLEHSGEQWDFPNGWAPLQHLMVDSLDQTGYPEAQNLALDLAQRWVQNNYEAFRSSNNTMFEKYDVQSIGAPGGGGEYEVVVGFGWSNGVIIDFLSRFGKSLPAVD